MPYYRRRRARHTTARRSRPFFGRRRHAPRGPAITTTTTKTVHHGPVTYHQRRPTLKDKVSGALLRLKGSFQHRPGVKAAGTRRMHGTDGRGARSRWRYRRSAPVY